MQHFDLVIVGGGMVGLSLALALADVDIDISVINSGPISRELPDAPELRVSAINLKNQIQFAKWGVWQALPENRNCPYHSMRVWDEHNFGRIAFSASEAGLPDASHLGTIVENQALVNALAEQVGKQANVTVIEGQIDSLHHGDKQHTLMLQQQGPISADVIVGADGARSFVRRQGDFPLTFGEYGQTALVATIRCELPHDSTARQVFTPHGPLALLPLADPHLCSIVWSQSSERATQLQSMPTEEFNKHLSVTSDFCLGALALDSERVCFPLKRQYARRWVDRYVVLCGDAAHTFHPLAGQGANLGFEDAWALANTLRELASKGESLRNHTALRQYERSRKVAAVKVMSTMELFHQLFTGDNPLKKVVRGIGLNVADKISPVKTRLINEALGI